MGTIIDTLEAQNKLLAGEGVSGNLVKEAEFMLKLQFSEEYKEYLQTFGTAAYRGHELTGITKSPRLNVVAVTLSEREKNPEIPSDLYVVERTNVEEIVIWQKNTGEIFFSGPNQPLELFCNSLDEYIRGKYVQAE